MKNVNFHVDTDIILQVKELRGELIPNRINEYPVFDNKESFTLKIFSAIISIDVKSLSNLLNRYVFGYESSPLKDINISTEGDQIRQEGKLKGIPFSIVSKASVTPDGKIKLHPVDIKAAGIGVSGIMKFFKIHLDGLLKLKKNHGAIVRDNDLFLDLSLMLI